MKRTTALALVSFVLACDGGGTDPVSGNVLTLTAQAATDTQTVVAGTSVPVLPSVLVTDAKGRPVEGARVTFAQAQNAGGISVDGAQTDADGMVRVTAWSASQRSGPATLIATITSNASAAAATFHLNVLPGPAVSIGATLDTVLVQPGAESPPLFVANLDQYGNAVSVAEVATVVIEDTSIATITPEGRIRGTKNGRSAILVTSASVSAIVPLTVGVGFLVNQSEVLVDYLRTFAVSSQNLLYALTDQGASDTQDLVRITLPFGAQAKHTLPTARPSRVAFTPDGAQAVVTAGIFSTSLYVLDVPTNAATDSTPLAIRPTRMLVSPNGAYALAVQTNRLVRIEMSTLDTVSLTLDADSVSGTFGMTMHPTLPVVYISNVSGWVAAVDYGAMSISAKVEVAGAPRGMAITPGGDSLYVTRSSGALHILDPATLALIVERTAITQAWDAVFSANGARLIVASRAADGVGNSSVRYYTRSGLVFLRLVPITGVTEVMLDGTGRAAVLSGVSRIYFLQ